MTPRIKIALDAEQDSTPHPSVSYGGSSATGAQPSVTTSTDLNTDMTREVRAGPAQDGTRACSEGHVGGDAEMRRDENSEVTRAQRGRKAEEGSQRRGKHMKSEMSNRAPLNSTFREGSSGRRLLKDTQLVSPRKRHWTGSVRRQ